MAYHETVEALTNPASAGDALTRHFLLVHPASLSRRTVLPGGRGVAAACRTSAGPLPLVVLRCRREEDIPPLLAGVLDPVARHYFITRPAYSRTLLGSIREAGDEEETLIHTPGARVARRSDRAVASLGEGRLEVITRKDTLTGADLLVSRVLLRNKEVSSAKVQWSSSGYAEIGVSTDPEHRRRGYARAAGCALTARLADLGLTALYIADKLNSPSLALAASLGFRPSGEGEFACSGFKR